MSKQKKKNFSVFKHKGREEGEQKKLHPPTIRNC